MTRNISNSGRWLRHGGITLALLMFASLPESAYADEGGVSYWLPGRFSSLAATPQVSIEAPDDRLIGDLIVKLLGDRGIAVPPEVPAFIVPRIERSYVAVQQVVAALDRAALSHHRRITVAMAKRALSEDGVIKRARHQAQ